MRFARIPTVPAFAAALALAAPASSQQAAPGTPTEQVQSCLGKVRLRGETFETESTAIVPEAQAVLDLVAKAVLDNCGGKKITIEGHCDVRGDDAYNQTLSEKRAEAVKEYLVSKGIPASQLDTVGYGESRPLSQTDHAMNRRVTFVVEGEPPAAP